MIYLGDIRIFIGMTGFSFCLLFQEAPHINLDGKLADLLNVTPGKCLQYVVIEGKVMCVNG